ncbi:MAG: hypothetical protein J7L25_02080 [Deltaproteobacteria bacterium]|nr:hypothetical protein [Candidatus Tharpella aukensis]
MGKSARLKTAALEMTEIASRIRQQLDGEDDICNMDDFDIVLRSVAATLSTISTASLLLPDAMVEMCEACLNIGKRHDLQKKLQYALNNGALKQEQK